ncbi:MAG: regulatory protein RecX [bacterium]|jgi:regulatory protein
MELAVGMLARRPLSEGEVAVRLARKGVAEVEIPAVLSRLRELGLLEDAALCRRLARSYQEDRRYGPAKIAWKLTQRRFPRELVEEALREVASPGAVAEAAVIALRKKFREGIPPGREGAVKAFRFLAGRGFPLDACRAAVGRRRIELSQGD